VWLTSVSGQRPIPATSWATTRHSAHQARPAKVRPGCRGWQARRLRVHDDDQQHPPQRAGGRVIQAQLREAGITMKIRLVDASNADLRRQRENFEMISFQWSGARPGRQRLSVLQDHAGHLVQNWSGISHPQLDALLDRSRESAPSRAQEDLSEVHEDPPGRAADRSSSCTRSSPRRSASACRATRRSPTA